MVEILEIRDTKGEALVTALPVVLEAIQEIGGSLEWSIFYLEVAADGSEIPVTEIMRGSENPEPGYRLDFDELVELSGQLTAIRSGLFVGCKHESGLQLRMQDSDLYQAYDVLVECFDGEYWRFTAREEAMLESVARRFKDVRLASLETL